MGNITLQQVLVRNGSVAFRGEVGRQGHVSVQKALQVSASRFRGLPQATFLAGSRVIVLHSTEVMAEVKFVDAQVLEAPPDRAVVR